MAPIRSLYRYLPRPLKSASQHLYDAFLRRRASERERERFVRQFFEPGAFDRYVREFEEGTVLATRRRARETFAEETSGAVSFGDVRRAVGRDVYALVRSQKPATVVETGVCNGFSTLCILAALDANERGHLHSVDYPYRGDDSLSDFRTETFDGYGGATLPAGKDPGWIVPDPLRERWSLTVGKSQRKLPEVVARTEPIDLFLHDSEHSVPCMLFEFELAWEHLDDDGLILADDVSWNDAFERFVNVRAENYGYIAPDVGYVLRQ